MNVFRRISHVAILAAVLLSPAAAQKGKEGVIYDQVKMRLANDPDIKGGNLTVDVKNGIVTLEGKVSKDRFKLKAEKLAKKVKGVTEVVNKLTVEP